MASPNPIVLIGPTASGKSDLAVSLALRLKAAEIVNTDSMQVYRGMDIGTATLPVAERGGVTHHLLDVLDPQESANVAQFQAMARTVIDGCIERGVTAVAVGGSALYVRAVIDDLEFPGTDPQVRTRWESQLATHGADGLHALLAERDPAAAAAILPSNGRRIVRALEVIDLTGRPFAATMPGRESIYPHLVMIGLDVPREILDQRIAARVDAMWAAGLVDEVRGLDLRDAPTASRAIGYRQVLEFLGGQISEDEARDQTIAATRKFARRQDRLFRQDPRISWLPFDHPALADAALSLIPAD